MIKRSIFMSFLAILFLYAKTQETAKPDYSVKTLHLSAIAPYSNLELKTGAQLNDDFLIETVSQAIANIEKYPWYIFNFDGALRYMAIKEQRPDLFEKIKKYVASGQWFIAGSSLSAFDVQLSSPLAISRSVMLAQNFYKQEFGINPTSIYLPSGTGFGQSLPALASYCGLKSFTSIVPPTGFVVEPPFKVCIWQGIDGTKIPVAFSPGLVPAESFAGLENNSAWASEIDITGKKNYGTYVGMGFFVQDENTSLALPMLEKSLNSKGEIKIIMSPANASLFGLNEKQLANMAIFNNSLLPVGAGTGSYTSGLALKRLNRKNELLAEAAEKAASVAWLATGDVYPQATLNNAWLKFLSHQQFEELGGSITKAGMQKALTDQQFSLEQFSVTIEKAVENVSKLMDTRAKGTAVVVYNPMATAREEPVEVEIELTKKANGVKVVNKAGKEIESQLLKVDDSKATVLFIASIPAMGFEVYDVQTTGKQAVYVSELKASVQTLENNQYVLFFDAKTGDVKRIIEKSRMRDLLVRPLRYAFFENSGATTANIPYNTIASSPKAYLEKPNSVEIIESGPVRATIKVERSREGSVFTQYFRLYAGKAGSRIEVYNETSWATPARLVKADIQLAFPSSRATLGTGLGVAFRNNNTEKLYEMAAQQWVDQSLPDASFGVSIFTDSHFGWDKPSDNALRLSLFNSLATDSGNNNTLSTDFGNHTYSFALYAHARDWRKAGIPLEAESFVQPLIAVKTTSHEGKLGKSFSFASLNTSDVIIKNIKKAEKSDELVIVVQEIIGSRAGNVKVSLPSAVVSAREISGTEEQIGEGRIENSQLVFSINAFQMKAFAVKLAPIEK